MGLEKIYTPEVIARSKDVVNRVSLPDANRFAEKNNPQCGDKIAIQIFKRDDGIVAGAAFSAKGCILSQASASMMIDLIRGKSVGEAKHLADLFLRMMRGEQLPTVVRKELGDTINFDDVLTALPSRSPCVTLAWETLLDALNEE